MFNVSDSYLDAFKAPAREITGAVICETADGEVNILPHGSLVSFRIEKTAPKGKLFGFAISQQITIEALGILEGIKKNDRLIPSIESKDYNEEVVDLPYFYVDTIEFNKVQNTTTIIGFDLLHRADIVDIGSLEFSYPLYTSSYARDVIEYLGGYGVFEGIDFLLREAPSFNDSDTLRTVITAIAEFTGTICYVSYQDTVRFRSLLGEDFTDVLTADDYIDLSVGEMITLTKVASSTELGDNYVSGVDGFTQVLWENPFLINRDDVAADLETIANKVRGISNIGYNLSWRGCPAYELGDLVLLQEKDGTTQYTRYFNEVLEYNGGLRASSDWIAGDSENVNTAPVKIGEVVRQTYAKVDKASQEIELAVSTVGDMEAKVSALELNTEGVQATVSNMSTTFSDMDERIATLTQKVEATMSAEEINIAIQESVENVDSAIKVTTTTGFKFDEEGLTVSKSDSELATQITEDGMKITKTGTEVLDVNNRGVYARNLQATTFLVIGENSRFEDYQNNTRTGCFWIGLQ